MSRSFFMIAGEASGDLIGSHLMTALKNSDDACDIQGIGGSHMAARGLKSLKSIDELSVMGLTEIVGELPRLHKLLNEVVEMVEARAPDAMITLDLPDFNFRVAQRLKKRGIFQGKIIHYVAPTVWAWRPGRAKAVSKFLDGLICLFPFEPAYFEPHNLPSVYAGHPVVESNFDQGNGKRFREKSDIPSDAKVLGLLYGSRQREVAMSKRVFKEVVDTLKKTHKNLHIVVPTVQSVEFEVRQCVNALDVPVYITAEAEAKPGAFAAMNAALAVSGTVGLELAYAGIPHVIGYKTSPLSWLMVKALVQVKYAHLANIILDKEVVPEFLQWNFRSKKIADKLNEMFINPEQYTKEFTELSDKLQPDNQKPSEKAAAFIVDCIEDKSREYEDKASL